LALTGACALPPSSTSKPAPQADLAAMSGYWTGEYVNSETGKTGTITLTIRSSTDSATGDIVIAAYGSSPVVAADIGKHRAHAPSPDVLNVVFRRVIGGMVEGTVEDYFSTDCSCIVTTVLQATPEKNRIAGAYVTSNTTGFRQQGRWSVDRQVIAADDNHR
jgi:hypothetical protein